MKKKIVNKTKNSFKLFREKWFELPESGVPKHPCFLKNQEFKNKKNVKFLKTLAKARVEKIGVLLQNEVVIKSIMTASIEIVLWSFQSIKPFKSVIDLLKLDCYQFYKVIELILRADLGYGKPRVYYHFCLWIPRTRISKGCNLACMFALCFILRI